MIAYLTFPQSSTPGCAAWIRRLFLEFVLEDQDKTDFLKDFPLFNAAASNARTRQDIVRIYQ